MRWPSFHSLLGALIAGVCGYLLALAPIKSVDMSAPLLRTQILPRLSHFSAHLNSSKSFWPAVQMPIASLCNNLVPQHHNFGTTANMTHDTMIFKDAVEHRRTIYQLTKKSTISDAKIKDIVTSAIKNVPSSFNSQSARLVVLLHDEHDKFWDAVRDILKGIVPETNWEHTATRIAGFRNAYGTVSLPLTINHMSFG